MHPNPTFRKESRERHLALARGRGFGTLAVSADPAPLLSHVPFLVDAAGEAAELHLVRSNPIVRLPDGPAVIAVSGPDGYVSPDWYETDDQVPTWNYVAVHLRGRLIRQPDETLPDMLARLSANFETRLAPKRPWTLGKMSAPALQRMLRQIVPFRFEIEAVDGTWKLNQNKDDAVRLRAAERIADGGVGQELDALAALMRNPDA